MVLSPFLSFNFFKSLFILREREKERARGQEGGKREREREIGRASCRERVCLYV